MAEPVFIYAYDERGRGVPVTDEDVARGFLEPGWAPMLCPSFTYPVSEPVVLHDGDVPMTGVLTFFECTWPLVRIPSCEIWVSSVTCTTSLISMWKIRMPIEEEGEELLTEPIALEDVQVGMVIACEVRMGIPDNSYITVCCGHADNGGPQLRLLGYQGGRDVQPTQDYNYFLVCKQPYIPFVLK